MNNLAISKTAAILDRRVTDLDDEDIRQLKQAVYQHGIVVLKAQTASAAEFVRFGRRIGEIRPYYEEMYRHPEHEEVFVSSNCKAAGKLVGVPRTGMFWHSDYAFMRQPFAFTITYPQVVSSQSRGTYFIDMAQAYRRLPVELRARLDGATATHSVRRYFKIRPSDVYRPIVEILAEVDSRTPAVEHPAVIRHPVTGESILYASRGFTESLTLANGTDGAAMLDELMAETGQTDDSFSHPNIRLLNNSGGDIIVWDNRRFVHHAKHSDKIEPTETFRLTAYDGHPFSGDPEPAHEQEGLSLV